MKLRLLVILCCISIHHARAQDSTIIKTGFRASGDFSLLTNASLGQIRQQFQQSGVDVSNVSTHVVSSALTFVVDRRKIFSESRLLFINSASANTFVASAQNKRASFSGFGIGCMYTLKLVDNRRFMVGPTLGFDFVWYRLRVSPSNAQSSTLSNVLANPSAYNTILFSQRATFNLTGAISADYKTGWFKKWYDEFRIGVRVGYQLPIESSKRWYYGDSPVNELSPFRSDMLFAQYSLTFIRRSHK